MHTVTHEPTIAISRAEARRAKRRLDDLLNPAPDDPFDFADCLALGAWRRLAAGERLFTPAMWDLIGSLQVCADRTAERLAAVPVRELADPEADGLFQNMVYEHVTLATGAATYGSDHADAQALLAAAGIIAVLELGATRFAGKSVLDFIDQPRH